MIVNKVKDMVNMGKFFDGESKALKHELELVINNTIDESVPCTPDGEMDIPKYLKERATKRNGLIKDEKRVKDIVDEQEEDLMLFVRLVQKNK